MKRVPAFLLCCLICSSADLGAEDKAEAKAAAAKAALLEEIRERIIWYDDEKTNPIFIPEDVLGLMPFEELPIPDGEREGIRMWISFRRDFRSPAGQRFPECSLPQVDYWSLGREPKTIEQAAADGPVTLLVAVDKSTVGYQDPEGMYRYNEVSILETLVGADFPYQDPLKTRAFLSEGGEVVIEGTRLCTFSAWHPLPPRSRATYLLIGAPGDRGIFQTNFYFRIENGNVVPANYKSLKQPEAPLPLDRIVAHLHESKERQ